MSCLKKISGYSKVEKANTKKRKRLNNPELTAGRGLKNFKIWVKYFEITEVILRSNWANLSVFFRLSFGEGIRSTFHRDLPFQSQNNIFLYFLDASFSVAFLGNLVVIFWRGLWILIEFLLFPNNIVWAAWASLVITW